VLGEEEFFCNRGVVISLNKAFHNFSFSCGKGDIVKARGYVCDEGMEIDVLLNHHFQKKCHAHAIPEDKIKGGEVRITGENLPLQLENFPKGIDEKEG